MEDDEREAYLEELERQGEEDGAEYAPEFYNPPHGFISSTIGLDDDEREEQNAYQRGWQRSKDIRMNS